MSFPDAFYDEKVLLVIITGNTKQNMREGRLGRKTEVNLPHVPTNAPILPIAAAAP